MKSFYVLSAPAGTDPDRDTLFIRDGFSWLAFLFPLPWLLIRRLWLVAIIATLLYAVSIYLAETYRFDALPIAFSFVLGLWTALEGGETRVRKYERLGWQVERVIGATCLADAEDIYFAEKARTARNRPAEPLPSLPQGRPARDANAVALGLIGPQIGTQGGR
jgi:hypothetical protein